MSEENNMAATAGNVVTSEYSIKKIIELLKLHNIEVTLQDIKNRNVDFLFFFRYNNLNNFVHYKIPE